MKNIKYKKEFGIILWSIGVVLIYSTVIPELLWKAVVGVIIISIGNLLTNEN